MVFDEIFCVLRGLAKTTEKKHVYAFPGICIHIVSQSNIYYKPKAPNITFNQKINI